MEGSQSNLISKENSELIDKELFFFFGGWGLEVNGLVYIFDITDEDYIINYEHYKVKLALDSVIYIGHARY